MGSDPIVELRDVVALLGRFPALSGLNLRVDPGEIVLVSGPNGAGKTTLLRVCAGLLPVTSGTAVIDGYDVSTQRRQVRASVGYVGHDTGLYPDLTVADNINFWSKAAGVANAEAKEAAQRLGVAGRLADVEVARLSAGQKKRVALAILVAKRHRIWLLDEPHAALDEASRERLDRVVQLAAEGGAAVVMASHELERAGALATRTVNLAGGHLPDTSEAELAEAANG